MGADTQSAGLRLYRSVHPAGGAAQSNPWRRIRIYSWWRVSPSAFAAFDLLNRALSSACSIIARSTPADPSEPHRSSRVRAPLPRLEQRRRRGRRGRGLQRQAGLAVIRPPSQSIAARSRMLRSSRTLPGQWYSTSSLRASREMPAGGRPGCGRSPRGTLRSAAARRRADRAAAAAGSRTRSAGSRDPRGTGPARIACCRSRFVAATTRASVRSTRVPPSRWNSRSCSTRRNLACADGRISPTSSRNSVPPAACSSCPGLLCVAPVKAPRSYPNSSASSSCSGSAAQLSAMNGPAARRRAMQEARDHFLARSRFAEQQHGRLGRRDLGRLRQHLAPLLRLADHATVAGARIELVGQQPDPALELGGALVGQALPLAQRRVCRASSAISWCDSPTAT